MFKCIALLKRKNGLSREQFIEYYETRHAPLMRRLLPQMTDYRRNYFDVAGAFVYPGASLPDFDVVTEMWVEDRAAYDAMIAIATRPDVARIIAEDEEHFLDRDQTRMLIVDERRSAQGQEEQGEVTDRIARITAMLTAPGALFELTEQTFAGEKYRYYKNAPANLRDMMAAGRAFANKTAMVYEGETWTFDAVYGQIDRIAHQLVHKMNVRKADRVAIAMRNYPEWITAFVAIASIGAIPVPLNSWGRSQELLHGLQDSGAKLVFCDQQRFGHISEISSQLDVRMIVARSDASLPKGGQVTSLEDFLSGAAAIMPEVEIDPEDLAMIMYSSGTTGRPKGVAWSHRNFAQTMFNYEFLGALVARLEEHRIARFASKGLEASDLLAVPLFHTNGLCSTSLPALRAGRKVTMMYKWNVERALDYIQEQRITTVKVAPSMTLELLDSPKFGQVDTSSLFTLGPGGSAHPSRLSALIATKCPEVISGAGWGTTETGGAVSSIFGTGYAQYPRSAGVIGPLYDVKICDETGKEVPAGQPGEILVRGVTIAAGGYWNRPEATAESFAGGWYRTGDVGYLDAKGLLYITDRIKDMVIRGGENIYCVEVENAIHEHPLVAEGVVFGVPHDILGEELVAAIRPKSEGALTAQDIKDHMTERVAGFKVPAHVVFYTQGFPRSPMGKILKRQLRDEVARAMGRA